MGGWRTKFVFLLVIYFAGFATAIYCLAPVPENRDFQPGERNFFNSILKSDDFAHSFNSGMHKCIGFGREAASRVGTFLKQKYDERQLRADG